ncbi:MAG: ABA4-like family protein [Gammaproteobacteria bacterium]
MLNVELVFSLAGLLAMAGWVTLLLSPLSPVWSDRIAGLIVPVLLSGGYVMLIVLYPSGDGGGFATFAEVTELFADQNALLAGWVHFLAFDLLVGAWICRTARREKIKHWAVVPCLPFTFMFGPAGYLLFSGVRFAARNPVVGSFLSNAERLEKT